MDSYPDKQFKGVVSEVQLNPVVTNNVVTYNVVMEVDQRAPHRLRAGPRRGRPRPAGPGGKRPGPGQPAATLEYTTARYMPPGSPVYKGDLALFPGMTANCTIVTNRKDNILRVPSAALRFNPGAFVPIEDKKPAAGPMAAMAATPAPAPGAAPGTAPAAAPGTARGMVAKRDDRLWVLVDGKPRAIPVRGGGQRRDVHRGVRRGHQRRHGGPDRRG